ncbi:MAG: hypothetical protein K9I29_06205 [Bacteroidales bacterium]|nr:hypothetical protein [Bacteroidales bacterium]MCF8327871.1 hypothetical protein [Bacteroidales bacterium]
MVRYVIYVLFLMIIIPLKTVEAQSNQPMRVEISSLGSQDDFHVLLAEENGFVIIRDDGKSSNDEIIIKLFCYSAAMEKKWNSTITAYKDYAFSKKYYRNGYGFLLFSDSKNKESKFKIFRIDIASGKVVSSEFVVEDKINPVDFKSVKGHSFVLGREGKGIGKIITNVFSSTNNKSGKLRFFHYDWEEASLNNLTASLQNNMQPRQLDVFEHGSAIDLYAVKAVDKYTDEIWRYSFSFGGALQEKHQYSRIKGKTVVNLSISTRENRRFLAATMSSIRDRYNHYEDYTDGIFVSIFSGEKEKKSIYHKLSNINAFYSHTNPNMFQFFPGKKDVQGSVGYQILLHPQAKSDKNQNIILAEAYYPEYRTDWYYDAYGVAHTRRVFEGYRFTHAMAVSFNNDGEIDWDVALKMPDIHSYARPRRAGLITDGTTSGIVYNFDNEISYQLVKENKKLNGRKTATLPLMNKNDNLKNSLKERIRFWYEDYMLASGYQKISNDKKGNRQVFYVYKIAFR